MVWFRVDDVLPFHQRVIEAGNAAMGLWVRAGAWSSGQLTDGFIPTSIARQMGTATEIKRLVAAGLWTREGDAGYRFHAWAEDGTGSKRQPTRAEVESQRKAERDRKAAYRAGRKDGQRDTDLRPPDVPPGQPQGHQEDGQQESRDASEYPVPSRPDPTQDSYVSPSSHVSDREAEDGPTDEADRSRREGYWRGWRISNPERLIAEMIRAVSRPVTEDQAILIVVGILSRAKQRPDSIERYVLGSIRRSWSEIQQELDETVVAA